MKKMSTNVAQHLCPKNSHEKVISKTLSKIFSLKEYYHVLQMMKNVSGLECRVAFRKNGNRERENVEDFHKQK